MFSRATWRLSCGQRTRMPRFVLAYPLAGLCSVDLARCMVLLCMSCAYVQNTAGRAVGTTCRGRQAYAGLWRSAELLYEIIRQRARLSTVAYAAV